MTTSDENDLNINVRIAKYAAQDNYNNLSKEEIAKIRQADYETRKAAYEAKKAGITTEEYLAKQRAEYEAKKANYRKIIAERTARRAQRINEDYNEAISNNISSKLRALSIIFFIFSIVCLCTMAIMDLNTGDKIRGYISVTKGGIMGPLDVKKDNAVYFIKVTRPLDANQSSYVSGSVLNNNKQPIFSFGEDLYDEQGVEYDSTENRDYPWHESKTDYSIKVNFPQKGIYYLQFESEEGAPGSKGIIAIEVTPKLGSSLAFLWLGIISFIISVGCFTYYIYKNKCDDSNLINLGKKIFQFLLYAALIVIAIWAEM